MKKKYITKIMIFFALLVTITFVVESKEPINDKLYKAAAKGDLEYVKKLVEIHKANVNYKTSTNKTPLINAVNKKRHKIVHYLLKLKDKKTKKRIVDFDAYDNLGETALYKACKKRASVYCQDASFGWCKNGYSKQRWPNTVLQSSKRRVSQYSERIS